MWRRRPATIRDVLRLETLDTDIPPPPEALEATREAIGEDEANSWLPFTGRDDLKEAVASQVERRGGPRYDGRREVVITYGEGDAMLGALFCLTDPGDEVILTDPTYAGMINRVRLVGAVPRLVRLQPQAGEWRLDTDELAKVVTDRTGVVFINDASFPTGWVASDEEWEAIASVCRERDVWLLYWAGYEAILFDGRTPRQPAALPGMRDRTVTVGAVSQRRDETLRQLDGLPTVRPAGAWSLLLDVAALGLDCAEVSNRLIEHNVAATPMRGWGGEIAERRRFVFSSEPVERLALLGDRLHRALQSAGLSS